MRTLTMKKKILKTTLVFISLTFIVQTNFSQNKVSYAYDAAGNRTNRTIVMQSKSIAQPDEETDNNRALSETLNDINVNIYPNPTEGRIRVDIENLPEGETFNLNLYSLSGHLIVSKKSIASSTEINISGHQKGVYILKIIIGKQQTEWKIIKK